MAQCLPGISCTSLQGRSVVVRGTNCKVVFLLLTYGTVLAWYNLPLPCKVGVVVPSTLCKVVFLAKVWYNACKAGVMRLWNSFLA
jgi:hypothetical protein